MSNISFFVTLTYDDDHLTFADDEACLCKSDMQLFVKRLRKRLEPKTLKYYCVGEYGEQWRPLTPKGRPHYHMLLFYKGDIDRIQLHLLIKELWFYGIAQVLPVNGAQGYVTKYVLKFDSREHLVKPFSLISQGLGAGYLTPSMIQYHRSNLIPFAIKPGGYHVNLPRYYKNKIFSTYNRLVLKKRADLYRQKLNIKVAAYEDLIVSQGQSLRYRDDSYKDRLYRSLKIYREKHKL